MHMKNIAVSEKESIQWLEKNREKKVMKNDYSEVTLGKKLLW